ncbi:MAG: SRPBCC family protein [Rhodobacteraceae bacterium]|jgi:carbon monoxide dehydrogenase subunit G|nr:SRPBCC family protein [Paracoccaceae bacterium]
MRFTASRDIAVPIADAWAALTDVEAAEGIARARGVAVVRTGPGGVGTTWQARFRLRGAERQVTLRIAAMEMPGRLCLDFRGELFEGSAQVDLLALARTRTRLTAMADVLPRTLAARLMLASARLVKSRADRRFGKAVGALARAVAAGARGAGG